MDGSCTGGIDSNAVLGVDGHRRNLRNDGDRLGAWSDFWQCLVARQVRKRVLSDDVQQVLGRALSPRAASLRASFWAALAYTSRQGVTTRGFAESRRPDNECADQKPDRQPGHDRPHPSQPSTNRQFRLVKPSDPVAVPDRREGDARGRAPPRRRMPHRPP